MLARHYARVREAFVAALHRAAPDLALHEVVWRYYWMGGSLLVSLAVPPGMVEASEHGAMTAHLVGFLVQGMRSAPATPVLRRQARGGVKALADFA
jgi:hypothetical protein